MANHVTNRRPSRSRDTCASWWCGASCLVQRLHLAALHCVTHCGTVCCQYTATAWRPYTGSLRPYTHIPNAGAIYGRHIRAPYTGSHSMATIHVVSLSARLYRDLIHCTSIDVVYTWGMSSWPARTWLLSSSTCPVYTLCTSLQCDANSTLFEAGTGSEQ